MLGMRCTALILVMSAVAGAVGCSDSTTPGGIDSGVDASADGGAIDAHINTDATDFADLGDAAFDARVDAGADAAVDMARVDASLPNSGAFFVTSALSFDTSGGGGGAPLIRSHTFSLFLDSISETTVHGVGGAFGQAWNVTFSHAATGAALELDSTFTTNFEDIDDASCGRDGPIRYQQMTITLSDSNADGVAEITGTANGTVDSFGGDVIWSTPFVATLTGLQENDAPIITHLVRQSDPVHPVDTVGAMFSEPLMAGVSGVMHSEAGDVPLVWGVGDDAPMYAHSQGMLPWGATMSVVLTEAKDLTGIVLAAESPTFTTAADPGVFNEWSFEASPIHMYATDAARREALSTFAYDDSGYALYVPSGGYDSGVMMYLPPGRATLRVPVSGSPDILTFDIALVLNEGSESAYFFGGVDVIVPSTGEHLDVALPDFDSAVIVNDHTAFERVQVLIGDAVFSGATELIVDVRGDNSRCGGFRPPPPRGVLIDNIALGVETL